MKYSPQLNLRTAYNFQESLITINDYLEFAKNNEFKFAFYNDVDTMHGAAEFYEKFSQAKIKPIIGLTIELEVNQKIGLHFYAKNAIGFKNLSYLSSELATKKLDQQELVNQVKKILTNDLILVASFSQEIDSAFINNLCENFDQTNLYYGIDLATEKKVNHPNIVYTNKIAYLTESDKLAYNVSLAIKQNVKVNLAEQQTWTDHHYLSDDQLAKINQSNQNLEKIANAINFDLFGNTKQHLMTFKTPNNLPQVNFIQQLTKQALDSYFKYYRINQNLYDKYLARLKYELKILEDMNFINYFLVVWDYVKYAKENNIMVGPGRGSAAGSLVAFLLRITDVDPLQYNLLFERFLNPERKTMPDIDLDFQDDRREEILEYLFEKYGVYHVATIVTYQTIGAKYALRDVFRVFDKNIETVNKISKLIPNEYQADLLGAIQNSKALQAYYENNQQEFQVALKLIGLPRQTGTHAAGVILSDVDLREVLPIRVGYNGIMQTQFDMNYLENLGLIKMDLLGLRNLSTLQEVKQLVWQSEKKDIIFNQIPLNDLKVYQQLNQGKTTGIFQLESPGMTDLVVKMQLKNIEDLSAVSALFRPGPKEMIPEYLKRRRSQQTVQQYILDPSLIDILKTSYGIVLYQEQVLEVLQKVAGFSLGKADIVRRAMGKKDYQKMESVKEEFLSLAIKNGYSVQKSQEIWKWIEDFAGYGFNKSHSIAYSYISYWLAYLKTYYPEQFYASLFNSSFGNSAKTKVLINEVNHYGIDFKGPNIRNINPKYVSYNKRIYAPLTLIKGIGPEFLKMVRKVYLEQKQKFDNFFTLMIVLVENGLNKSNFEALVWAGAFDSYDYQRQDLINNIDSIFTFAEVNKKKETIDLDRVPVLTTIAEIDDKTLYENENTYLGFYLSTNPFVKLRKEQSQKNLNTLTQIANKLNGGYAIINIKDIRTKRDKNDQLMAFVQISDDTETLSATIFSRVYEEIKDQLNENMIVLATIKIDNYNNQKRAIINKIDQWLN